MAPLTRKEATKGDIIAFVYVFMEVASIGWEVYSRSLYQAPLETYLQPIRDGCMALKRPVGKDPHSASLPRGALPANCLRRPNWQAA